MDSPNQEESVKACQDSIKVRERRQKRADVQIYRPGALRLMKEATTGKAGNPNLLESHKSEISPSKNSAEENIQSKPKKRASLKDGKSTSHSTSSNPSDDRINNSPKESGNQIVIETDQSSLVKNKNAVEIKSINSKQNYKRTSPRSDQMKDKRKSETNKQKIKPGQSAVSNFPFDVESEKPNNSQSCITQIKDDFLCEPTSQAPALSQSSVSQHVKNSSSNVNDPLIDSNSNTGYIHERKDKKFSHLDNDPLKHNQKISASNFSKSEGNLKGNVKNSKFHPQKRNKMNASQTLPEEMPLSRQRVGRSSGRDSNKIISESSNKVVKTSFKKTYSRGGSKSASCDFGKTAKNLLTEGPRKKELNKQISQSSTDHKQAETELSKQRSSGSRFPAVKSLESSIKELNFTENSADEHSDDDRSDNSINPRMFVKKVGNSKIRPLMNDTLVQTRNSDSSQTVRWADEKWSPVQKQKMQNKVKEIPLLGSPTQRGIIQVPTSPIDSQQETPTSANSNKKVLFNPNDPSKPVIVASTKRDLSSSWDNSNYSIQDSGKTSAIEQTPLTNENNEINSSKIDPTIFYNIQKGEMDINYYVSSNQLPQEFRRIMDIRLHLQGCYRQLLVNDIRLCQERNLEGALWKSLYYVIIEKLREYINRDPSLKDRSLSTLHMLVDEGHQYLQGLLSDLQNAYEFCLETHLEKDLTILPSTKNRVKQAIHSCQKILLSIGDLARYKEQYSPNPNFTIAKNWYQMALQVQPRNGRPFNQLAIIAVSLKRPLDVVYYYIRSLSAANPFTSARDSLISMFDDIRKKYETMEKKPTEEKKTEEKKASLTQRRSNSGSLRQEIWIRPDSGATNKRTLSQSEPEEEGKARIEELLKLQTEQLMKSFLTCYLHCHGMLFSKVGLDHFTKVLGKTLDLFQALLKQNPPRMSPIYLLQIMAINMFAIENTQLKDSRLESGYRSAAQDLALLLGQEMFARLAEVMVRYFPSSTNYNPQPKQLSPHIGSPRDEKRSPLVAALDAIDPCGNFNVSDKSRFFQHPLAVFVPAAKAWCDWLLYQSFIWNPPPSSHDLPPGIDAWTAVGELATIVKGIGAPDIALYDEEGMQPPNYQTLILPEDKFLRGYSPILTAHRNMASAPLNCSLERARDWLRMKRLQVCLSQFLCGVEPPILRLQKTDKGEILVPVVADTPPSTPSVMRDSLSSDVSDDATSSSDEDGGGGSSNWQEEVERADLAAAEGGEGEKDTSPLASTVRLLAHRKKVLERRQKQQRKLHALMEGSVTLQMEVRPRYLVPDTNCFIEHLDILRSLINKTPYILMIPLVVLNELKGLAKDAAVEKYGGDMGHAVTVRENASSTLDYLQHQRSPSLKYVTSEGSILQTSTFTDELNVDQESSNDDKILSCCINFCSSTNKQKPIKEGVRHIYREVVLLTEDRNLRVKAYASDVPVRDLIGFAHWAGIK